jgi:hypothetical protein
VDESRSTTWLHELAPRPILAAFGATLVLEQAVDRPLRDGEQVKVGDEATTVLLGAVAPSPGAVELTGLLQPFGEARLPWGVTRSRHVSKASVIDEICRSSKVKCEVHQAAFTKRLQEPVPWTPVDLG